eukprot:TRINITY_DN75180_c0_g1_i1.p1 TRINITY_DN75180_c0_g1~~TRINITY_DN75180_c0_g1_i1.p1  ORF type:complete len:272 (+),score=5.39 TRINITY_DN75180_c0_g1_i1:54-869(+)
MASLKLAVYQVQGVCGAIDPNVALIEKGLACASMLGAQLLVLPELFLSGYELQKDELPKVAVTCSGPIMSRLQQSAKQAKVALSFGFVESDPSDGAVFYNSVVLINQDGEILSVYRKTHLWGPIEQDLYTPGDDGQYKVVDLDGTRVGMLICYDTEFPEPSRCLGLQGVDLIIAPTANPPDLYERNYSMVKARAIENVCTIAYVNRCGEERGKQFGGQTVVTGPVKDVVRAPTDEEAFLFASIDDSSLRDSVLVDTPYFQDRKPHLYGALT